MFLAHVNGEEIAEPKFSHAIYIIEHCRSLLQYLLFPQNMALPLLAFIFGILTVVVVFWMNNQRQGRHLPPGPKKLPFIGNLLSMPNTLEWETFAKWGQEHSP